VIYYDHKGVLRKEKSWNSWRDEKIEPCEFDNIPTEGFVLNKGVGGNRHSYGWNVRNEYIRVFDPRNFEFEISVANLLFILRECDCSRGKGLEGKFVYAWDKTELVLLPECSLDYQHSQQYTELQASKVKAKDLIPGATYTTKYQTQLVYLGRLDWYCMVEHSGYKFPAKHLNGYLKKHIFYDGKDFQEMDSVATIAALHSDAIVPNYADLVDRYQKSAHGSKPVRLYLEEQKDFDKDLFFIQEGDLFVECRPQYDWWSKSKLKSIDLRFRIHLTNNVIHSNHSTVCYVIDSYRRNDQQYPKKIEPNKLKLFAELESGSIFEVTSYGLKEVKNGKKDN
jgi:hypothetical protein